MCDKNTRRVSETRIYFKRLHSFSADLNSKNRFQLINRDETDKGVTPKFSLNLRENSFSHYN